MKSFLGFPNNARRRRPARWPVIGPLVILAVVTSACGSGARPQAGPEVIPWIEAPGATTAVTPAPRAQRACAASELRATAGSAGAYHGQATQELRFTNQANAPCFLPSVPTLELRPESGEAQQVPAGAFANSRLDLALGQSALVLVGAPGACAGAGESHKNITAIEVGAPGGGTLLVQGIHLDVWCGPASVVLFQLESVDSQAPARTLDVRIDAPDSVARGQTFSYTVTLTNLSAAPMALSPCPSYSQSLYSGGVGIEKTLLLNCAAITSPASSRSAIFEMRLAVTANFPTGGAKLSWRLEEAGGAIAATPIIVK